jgi:hypothetical protein
VAPHLVAQLVGEVEVEVAETLEHRVALEIQEILQAD